MKTKQILGLTGGLALALAAESQIHAGGGPFDAYSRKSVHPAEIYTYGRTIKGDTDFQNGITTKESGWGGGVGFGGNLSDYVNLNIELGGGGLDTTATRGRVSAISKTDFFEMRLGMDYNVLKYRLTPVLTGSLGLMKQSDGSGQGGFEEWTFTYGGGAGLRWDITDRILAKAIYRAEWTSFEGSTSATLYHGFFGSIGFKF